MFTELQGASVSPGLPTPKQPQDAWLHSCSTACCLRLCNIDVSRWAAELEAVLEFLAAPRLERLELSADLAHFGRHLPVLQRLTNVTHFNLQQNAASVRCCQLSRGLGSGRRIKEFSLSPWVPLGTHGAAVLVAAYDFQPLQGRTTSSFT